MFRMYSCLLIACISLACANPAQSEPLKGFVETVDAQPGLQAQVARLDVEKPAEHCACVNPNKVRAVQVNGQWRLQDEDTTLVNLTTKEAAEAAVSMIRTYNMTDICTLSGKADTKDDTFNATSVYFKTREGAPSRAIAKEDAIRFDAGTIKAEQRNGTWKVIAAGDLWLLDFGTDEAAARHAAEIIQWYGFANQCFVGAPARELMYWHK